MTTKESLAPIILNKGQSRQVGFETARVGRGFAFGGASQEDPNFRGTFHTVGNTP